MKIEEPSRLESIFKFSQKPYEWELGREKNALNIFTIMIRLGLRRTNHVYVIGLIGLLPKKWKTKCSLFTKQKVVLVLCALARKRNKSNYNVECAIQIAPISDLDLTSTITNLKSPMPKEVPFILALLLLFQGRQWASQNKKYLFCTLS